MKTFSIKKQDTLPVLSVELQFNNGSPVNLTNGSVFFYMGQLNNFSPFFSGACTITTAGSGKAEYRWLGSPDTFVTGTYWCEFQAIWTGSQMTLPPNHSLQINVYEDYE